MDNNNICEYSGLPSIQSYITNPQAEGAGDKSIKEKFIDSSVSQTSGSVDGSIDFMYNWIRKHSGK